MIFPFLRVFSGITFGLNDLTVVYIYTFARFCANLLSSFCIIEFSAIPFITRPNIKRHFRRRGFASGFCYTEFGSMNDFGHCNHNRFNIYLDRQLFFWYGQENVVPF